MPRDPSPDQQAVAVEAVAEAIREASGISPLWGADVALKSARAAIAAHLAALAEAGMVVVPVEPADDVIEAMAAAHEASHCMDLIGPMEAAYRALAALQKGEA